MSLIRSATAMIERAAALSGRRLLCGVSGKDSLVVLDLCHQVLGSDLKLFHWYILEGLEAPRPALDGAKRRYGLPIHMFPHVGIITALKWGVWCDVNLDVPELRQTDIERVMKKRTDTSWMAYGHRVTDSMARRGMLKPIQGFDLKGGRVYPIWDWKTADVLAYLRKRKIAAPSMIGGTRCSGVDLTPQGLLDLKEQYPNDYERIRSAFPHVEAAVIHRRQELEKRDRERAAKRAARAALKASEIRDGAEKPKRANRRTVQPAND